MAFIAFCFVPSFASADPAPDPRTEAAVDCLLGLAPDTCLQLFAYPRAAVRYRTFCAEEYVHRRLDNCSNGYLETIRYLGTNAAGADAYGVKFQGVVMTYFILPPAPHGRITGFVARPGPPENYFPSSWFAVTSPVDPPRTLYVRHPEEGPGS
jgi:hypothetical protein